MNVQSPSSTAAAPGLSAKSPVFCSDAPNSAPSDPVVRLFAELLGHSGAQTPLAVAVLGGAGSGKTSFVESTLARLDALTQAARAQAQTPFLSDVAAIRVDLSRLSAKAGRAEVAALLSNAMERGLRRAGGAFSRAADEAASLGADAQAEARAAAEAYDAAHKRLDAEARELEQAKSRRARLSDALLYDTPGSKVDSFARGRRSRIEPSLRAFGYGEGDMGASYRHLVNEVAETGARVAPALARAVWGFPKQQKLLVKAAICFGLWILVGWAKETQLSWAPWLRAQNAGPLADALTGGALNWASRVAFWAGMFFLGLNMWRAWRFVSPLAQGARLLQADVAERGAEIDRAVEALSQRVETLRADAEAARKRAEAAAKRAVRNAGDQAAADELQAAGSAERFLEAAPKKLAREGSTRLVLALDGLDHLPPSVAFEALETAARLAATPGVALVAAFDPSRLAQVADGSSLRARLERLFQASWRVETPNVADQERLVLAALHGERPTAAMAAEADRSVLDEPLTPAETELLQRLAPLTGGAPRQIKRFVNLYRIARLATSNRAALALGLAAEIGGASDQVAAALEAVSSGHEAPKVDSAAFGALAAARAAAPAETLTPSDLSAARRLARRFAAFESD